MDFELIKKEFIKLKKEELEYIDNVARISSSKRLSELEKLEIYRRIKKFEKELSKVLKQILKAIKLNNENPNEIIIEFDIDKNYLSSLNNNYEEGYREYLMEEYLGINIETYKYELTESNLFYSQYIYKSINPDLFQNKQHLIETPIYIFDGYFDYSEDSYGSIFGANDINNNNYLYGIYIDIFDKYSDYMERIPKNKINDFEKGKIIIHKKKFVDKKEIKIIFEEELLNNQNKSIDDCVEATRKRIEELSYVRSPEYKEKVLLDKINEMYRKIKGEFIKKEILYNDDFLEIFRETYKLQNEETIEIEKVSKNSGNNMVLVIGITQDKKYIITFQNRIKDELIAEFPGGYIKEGEDAIEAAKRKLNDITGYISDNLFVIDKIFTSPEINNSITYIIIAYNCIKSNEIKNDKLLTNTDLFSEKELKYLVYNNIMSCAISKLAYYYLTNNIDHCYFSYFNKDNIVYKKPINKKVEL